MPVSRFLWLLQSRQLISQDPLELALDLSGVPLPQQMARSSQIDPSSMQSINVYGQHEAP